jgi:hypothetical protein
MIFCPPAGLRNRVKGTIPFEEDPFPAGGQEMSRVNRRQRDTCTTALSAAASNTMAIVHFDLAEMFLDEKRRRAWRGGQVGYRVNVTRAVASTTSRTRASALAEVASAPPRGAAG